MRLGIAILLAALTTISSVAFADLPPPPDLYTGPTETTLAGLKFVRQRIRHLGPLSAPVGQRHPFGYEKLVFLRDCAASHPNCRLANAQHVVGWAVTTINGTPVNGELGAFEAAFLATPPGRKVKLTLEFQNDFAEAPTPGKRDVLFDRK